MGVVAVRVGVAVLLAWAAEEDLRFRVVSSWTLAGLAALTLTCAVFSHTLVTDSLAALAWLLVGWVSGMGGADAKVLAFLALCSPALSLAAWGGMAVWYVAWRLWRREAAAPVLPGAAVVVVVWLVLL